MANADGLNANTPLGEKDFADHLHGGMENGAALQRIRTAGSVSISPELFEKLYLEPRSGAAPNSEIRKSVGNPTPIALAGFLLALTPLTCDLMGWRGALQANGSASIGAYFFFGGLTMMLGGVGEFIVGNTFPCVVFICFGAFWLTFGATLQPFYGASSNYAVALGQPAAMGAGDPGFLNAFGFFLLWMGVLSFVFMICALRTNVVFFGIFFTLVFGFEFLCAAFWKIADGQAALGGRLIIAGGAFLFVTCMLGWWIFAAILLASLDFPFSLPVGDLSVLIKGANEKASAKRHEHDV